MPKRLWHMSAVSTLARHASHDVGIPMLIGTAAPYLRVVQADFSLSLISFRMYVFFFLLFFRVLCH